MEKKITRQRRARKTRTRIKGTGSVRLCINRTPRHIYAQVISPDGSSVMVSASTVEKVFRESGERGGNSAAAARVDKMIAERAVAAGINEVAFDRSGFKYHGRIKALADAAREGGLKF